MSLRLIDVKITKEKGIGLRLFFSFSQYSTVLLRERGVGPGKKWTGEFFCVHLGKWTRRGLSENRLLFSDSGPERGKEREGGNKAH